MTTIEYEILRNMEEVGFTLVTSLGKLNAGRENRVDAVILTSRFSEDIRRCAELCSDGWDNRRMGTLVFRRDIPVYVDTVEVGVSYPERSAFTSTVMGVICKEGKKRLLLSPIQNFQRAIIQRGNWGTKNWVVKVNPRTNIRVDEAIVSLRFDRNTETIESGIIYGRGNHPHLKEPHHMSFYCHGMTERTYRNTSPSAIGHKIMEVLSTVEAPGGYSCSERSWAYANAIQAVIRCLAPEIKAPPLYMSVGVGHKFYDELVALMESRSDSSKSGWRKP